MKNYKKTTALIHYINIYTLIYKSIDDDTKLLLLNKILKVNGFTKAQIKSLLGKEKVYAKINNK